MLDLQLDIAASGSTTVSIMPGCQLGDRAVIAAPLSDIVQMTSVLMMFCEMYSTQVPWQRGGEASR